jgi:hypothetical protein
MPRKIRLLKADLRRADYQLLPGRGKGDHTAWRHPLVGGRPVILDGQDGDDAKRYQEQDVRQAVLAARWATEGQGR